MDITRCCFLLEMLCRPLVQLLPVCEPLCLLVLIYLTDKLLKWLADCRIPHFFTLRNFAVCFGLLSTCTVELCLISFAAPVWIWAESIALNTAQFILLLLSAVRSSQNSDLSYMLIPVSDSWCSISCSFLLHHSSKIHSLYHLSKEFSFRWFFFENVESGVRVSPPVGCSSGGLLGLAELVSALIFLVYFILFYFFALW